MSGKSYYDTIKADAMAVEAFAQSNLYTAAITAGAEIFLTPAILPTMLRLPILSALPLNVHRALLLAGYVIGGNYVQANYFKK